MIKTHIPSIEFYTDRKIAELLWNAQKTRQSKVKSLRGKTTEKYELDDIDKYIKLLQTELSRRRNL
jgi:hypothetical protein